MKNSTDKDAYKGQRGNVYKIELHQYPDLVQEVDGFNVRQDYGDIEWLKNSIINDGLRVPAQGHYKDGVWRISDGHRRLKAAKLAVAEGHEVIFLIQAEPQGYAESDRLLDMITRNSGLPLSMLEEATLFARLAKLNWDEHQIAAKTGKTIVHVRNCFLLLESTAETKAAIALEKVAASTVVEMLRDANAETVEAAVTEALDRTGKARVTKKDIPLAQKEKKTKPVAPELPSKIADELTKIRVIEGDYDKNEIAEKLKEGEKVVLDDSAQKITVNISFEPPLESVFGEPEPDETNELRNVPDNGPAYGFNEANAVTVDVLERISRHLDKRNEELTATPDLTAFETLGKIVAYLKGELPWGDVETVFLT